MKREILMVLLAAALQAVPAQAQQEVVTIDQSPPLVGRTAAAQRFADYLNINQAQVSLPLTLTFYNGADKAPGFSWLRVSIGGRPSYTEKDFRGGKVFSDNVTGDIGAGATQILINAGGPLGATVQWALTTPKPVLSKATPDPIPTGQTLTLQGSNFGRILSMNAVTIDNKPVDVVSATDSSLQVKIPNDAKGGKAEVLLTVAGMKTEPLKITIQSKPEVTSVNMFSAPPGQPLVISGKNFSAKATDNKVTIGDYAADVTSASPTSLTVTIPMALDPVQPVWGLPVVVTTGGVKSNDDVTVNVQQRVIETDSQSPVAAPGGPFF
jgi:hypothetical protein